MGAEQCYLTATSTYLKHCIVEEKEPQLTPRCQAKILAIDAVSCIRRNTRINHSLPAEFGIYLIQREIRDLNKDNSVFEKIWM